MSNTVCLAMKHLSLAFALLGFAAMANAKIITKSVDYSEGGVALKGYLAYDDAVAAKGAAPGVLIIHEWWGLNGYAKARAEKVAALGYVAFAADMYGGGVFTTEVAKAKALSGPFYGPNSPMVARAKAGLDQRLATGLVDPARVAAIGYCFGGSTCQALAYSGAPIAGIVSFHGGLIPVPADAASKTKAKLLICQGAVDPFVPKADRDTFLKAMDDGKFDYQFVSYAGAVHAFTNPEADALAKANGLSGIGYNAAADRRSWSAMKVFFKELFAPEKA